MTTTRKATNCTDCDRPLNSGSRDTTNPDLCIRCSEYAAWENTHEDEGHDDDNRDDSCPVCQGEAPTYTPRTGHTNGKPLSHTSHAGHDHPATKAARAACRKAAAKA